MLSTLTVITALLAAGVTGGKVTGAHGAPLPGCFVALYDTAFATRGSATTDERGAFAIEATAADGFFQVQPTRKPGAGGFGVYAWQPRIYAITAKDVSLNLALPPAVNYIIAAYGDDGTLMRWKDWEARGKYGPQFLYATDKRLRALPATVYPVYGELTGGEEGGRPSGLPALLVEPGQDIEIHALYWQTRGYGRLQLSAPVAALGAAGQSAVINWNHALAEAAIARARENTFVDPAAKEWFLPFSADLDALELEYRKPAGALATPAEAAAADSILARALDVADRASIERGKRRALQIRYGTPAPPSFLFGAYQGSPFVARPGEPYAGERGFSAARDGGFSLATILPAWGWSDQFLKSPALMESTFGPGALKKMGYAVKAHGVCWLQDFMDILPKDKRALPHDQLIAAALDYQKALLAALGDNADLWEAINEPATTNVAGFTREEMIALMKAAAANAAAAKKPALVNSPHEFNYGAKYAMYRPDGKPVDAYPDTFASFLDAAATAKALGDVSIIGLQVYPGFHLSGTEPGKGFEGPAWTPAFFERMLDTYAAFKKTIHITEFSIPSSYNTGWKSGYWKQPWNEATQADYAEAIYAIAFGHPAVQSIGWWDVTDEKPSVETGGMLHADLTPKPVFERLASFIAAAQKPAGASLPAGAKAR